MGRDQKASSQPIRRRRRKNRYLGSIIVFLLVFFIVAGCSGYVAWYLFMPNGEMEDYHAYYNLPPDEISVVLRDVRLDLAAAPVENNGSVCFPLDFVKEYIDPYIYWDKNALKLTVTTPDKVIRMIPGQPDYTENGGPVSAGAPVYLLEEEPYMPSELLTRVYHVSLDYHADNKIVVLNYLQDARDTCAVTLDGAPLRFLADKKAPVMYKFSKGETAYTFAKDGEYTRVRAENGLVGYVLASQIQDAGALSGVPEAPPARYPAPPAINGKVNMIWDQVFSAGDNAATMKRTIEDGLDVISPTWFSFDLNLTGDIVSLADADYVKWAHSHGCQVWALLSDFSSDTNAVLNQDISHEILTDTDKRDHAISRIMELIAKYNLDGVNIDFEYIQPADAGAYLEFFRELRPHMKAAGTVLSVDMYSPDETYWSKYYNRTDVGQCVDYMCVMAYDQNKSDAAGPDASMPYVRNGVELTLEEAPKEKILMGLPYFVRVWRKETADGKVKNASQAYDLDAAYKFFKDNKAQISWDDVFGAYYATFTGGGGVVYEAWLEEKRSIEEKLKYMRSMDLAGVAGWKWGLENRDVWDLLRQYVN